MKTARKSKVFKRAYGIAAVTGKSWPVCLAKSWVLERLVTQMKQGPVSFAYEKADGTLRKAKGTLKDVEKLIKGVGADSLNTIRYYDLDFQDFRSFRIENFITVY